MSSLYANGGKAIALYNVRNGRCRLEHNAVKHVFGEFDDLISVLFVKS